MNIYKLVLYYFNENKMNNTLIFIRHAKTKIDKETPIADWDLTKEGYKQAEKVKDIKEFQDVNIIISSTEQKASLTIKPLADKLGKEIIQIKEFNEIKRPGSEKLTPKQYEDMKIKIFHDLNFTDYGWETANQALERFKKATEQINKDYDNKKILVCVHGSVMTLYFAYLQNKLNCLMERWKNTNFGSYGVIKDNKVLRDIV